MGTSESNLMDQMQAIMDPFSCYELFERAFSTQIQRLPKYFGSPSKKHLICTSIPASHLLILLAALPLVILTFTRPLPELWCVTHHVDSWSACQGSFSSLCCLMCCVLLSELTRFRPFRHAVNGADIPCKAKQPGHCSLASWSGRQDIESNWCVGSGSSFVPP